MKADLQTQYDRLIQGTSDPNEIASLKTQEQQVLANLTAQEQRDMSLASQGCLQASNSQGNNPNAGGVSQWIDWIQWSDVHSAARFAIPQQRKPGDHRTRTSDRPGHALAKPDDQCKLRSTNHGPIFCRRLNRHFRHRQHHGGRKCFHRHSTGDVNERRGNGRLADRPYGHCVHFATRFGFERYGIKHRIQFRDTEPSDALDGHAQKRVSSHEQRTTECDSDPDRQFTLFATGATTVSFVRSATQLPGNSTTPATSSNVRLQAAVLASSIPPSLQAGQIQAPSSTIATVPLTINPAAAPGTYDITVITPTSSGTETVSLNSAFAATTAPTFSGINETPGTEIAKKTGSTSASAKPTSATYIVKLNGLLCAKGITGGGDAIYAAAVVRQYDRRNGQSTMLTNVNTWVYGDVNKMQDQRKQAGSAGSTGGIRSGDLIPPGFVPGIKDTLPPQANVFPMELWQGTLTDGVDALVVSPSLWI